jgi:hypothetical protein
MREGVLSATAALDDGRASRLLASVLAFGRQMSEAAHV